MERFGKPLPSGAPTVVAFARHPLHPMLVTFPIAFLLGGFATDLAYWYSEDPFWARVSLWLIGAGAFMGILAGIAGTVELLWVKEIRRRPASWNHFVLAVMLLATASINWVLRYEDPVGSIVPRGLALSGLGAALVGAAGWLGGKLVFEHQIAVEQENEHDTDPLNLADHSDR
ncbi:DUF2231 domain-containing protein [Verticiella sediminum]|uniref:DUF2231 domain-containing protein n=1 Tax=Verticiella sediminum TaxID=1247510 RepID=A0A556AB56_9BURK|nr:DUF2231 domain-containing protein [Verticiella sediminum]TSH90125.1 DUF2231 domain-containing protein [Verticiella sediminum]